MEIAGQQELVMDSSETQLNLEAVREKLAGKTGKEFWRSLEEVAETQEFQAWVEDEFPHRASISEVDRRSFLKYMGASLALAGLSGCRGMFLPQKKIVPYVNQPEELVPGKPLFYATVMSLGGYATGLLVEQATGRPIKIEGNPEHPASLGATDAIMQGALLDFYDPDRSQDILEEGRFGTWDSFLAAARARLAAGGAIRLLTGTIGSPVLAAQIEAFLRQFPSAKWVQYEPGAREGALEGARQAFGRPLNPVYHFREADVVVSLDCDFLGDLPGKLRYARDFADGRRLEGNDRTMNRLYAFESTPGLAGGVADHRWPVRPSEVPAIAQGLWARINAGGDLAEGAGQVPAAVLNSIAKDLMAHRGRSLVLPGEGQPAELHALAHAINAALGSIGTSVTYTQPVEISPEPQAPALRELAGELHAGKVEALIILGGNPAYDAPGDLKFAEAIKKAAFSVHLSLFGDETSALCTWHLPETHFLEAWGDGRAYDGTLSIQQPLIEPLYPTAHSALELLSALRNKPKGGYDLVREHHRAASTFSGDFEKAWRKALHDGFVPGAGAVVAVTPTVTRWAAPAASGEFEVVFKLDPSVHDGRFANNGWMQELPRPWTKLTWDNAALVSPGSAEKLGVQTGQMLEIEQGGAKIVTPVWVLPGQPDGVVTLTLGFGREKCGIIGQEVGHNVYPLRKSDQPWLLTDASVKKGSGQYKFASTQIHHDLGGKDVVRVGTLEEMRANPNFQPAHAHHGGHGDLPSLYPKEIFPEGDLPQWGMTVDMNACIGCNACVTACQAENNTPVVGKSQVARGREMHWIRIDRYYQTDKKSDDPLANPQPVFQPVMCVHCESAPCEPVCPVAATVHSHEGLNQMIYNRCIGTRYCSNNCPYKVRRFNFLDYPHLQKQFTGGERPKLLKLLNNPDVSVRSRGVMEKCTYCVQRINEARIEAKKERRPIRDGEVVTACQQVCPTRAITFGNIADKDSKVAHLRHDPRGYLLLEELNVRPRTTHLAKVRNPNPEIQA